jgi:hypothetical protein
MAELTLRFGLNEGRNANALYAAESLAAWVHLTTEAAKVLDPSDRVIVELVGITEGSLQFKQILKKIDQTIADISSGADEYPHLKAVAIGMAATVAVGTTEVAIERAVTPNIQVVSLSDTDRKLLKEMRGKIDNSERVRHASRRFLQSVERDPAITEVTVSEDDSEPMVVIGRDNFPGRDALWEIEDIPPAERITRDNWDVVLVKASFVNRPARWMFSRDGLNFSAKMDDRAFLSAIRDGRVPITLQEGVMMRIEVEFKEQQEGQIWRALDSTRRVVRVVSPQPLAQTLAASDNPKKYKQANQRR